MTSSRTRMGRKKGTRTRKKSKILSILFLILLATIAYSVYEYNQGYLKASSIINKLPSEKADKNNEDEFIGKTDREGKVNVLLLGADSSSFKGARTDTIMIAQYDPQKGSIKLASIMRDLYVDIPGYSKNKINTAFALGGPELLRQTIKENFDIDVEYYAVVNFDGFTEAVDVVAPNGIEIDVEKKMRYVDKPGNLYINLDPGIQQLNGKDLLDYARFRNDRESDFGRVRRQQQVIQAVIDEFISVKGLVKLPRIIGTVEPYIETNISTTDLIALGKDFLLNPASDVESLRIPVDNGFTPDNIRHAGAVLIMDKDKNLDALKQFFSMDSLQKTVSSSNEDNEA
jgi:LCP family protein required for cell wall assembly